MADDKLRIDVTNLNFLHERFGLAINVRLAAKPGSERPTRAALTVLIGLATQLWARASLLDRLSAPVHAI